MPEAQEPYPSEPYLEPMYTGKTEQPCCLCDDPETAVRIDIPPRAVQLMKNSGPIAWRDIEGDVSVYFCQSDWAVVRDLVLDTGMTPLPRCNVARASFVLREDFEALLNATRDEPNQDPLEAEMLEDAGEVIKEYGEEGTLHSERDLVEARIVTWALEELDESEAGVEA